MAALDIAITKWIEKNRIQLKKLNSFTHMHQQFLLAHPEWPDTAYARVRRIARNLGFEVVTKPGAERSLPYYLRMDNLERRIEALEAVLHITKGAH